MSPLESWGCRIRHLIPNGLWNHISGNSSDMLIAQHTWSEFRLSFGQRCSGAAIQTADLHRTKNHKLRWRFKVGNKYFVSYSDNEHEIAKSRYTKTDANNQSQNSNGNVSWNAKEGSSFQVNFAGTKFPEPTCSFRGHGAQGYNETTADRKKHESVG